MNYDIYQLKIKVNSSFKTPFHSDTLFGHIVWAVSYLEGEECLKEFLNDFEENPPFIISNAFINNNFPLINKAFILREDMENLLKNKLVDNYFTDKLEKLKKEINDFQKEILFIKKIKEFNKIKHINLNYFNKLRRKDFNIKDLFIEYLSNEINEKEILKKELVFKNIINRNIGSTEENGIFSQNEIFCNSDIYIYFKVLKNYDIEKLKKYLNFIEINGYGSKKSSGKGNFEIIHFEKNNEIFPEINNVNSFINLSNYAPKKEDYKEVIYSDIFTKFAKIGENFEENIYKKPIVFYKEGSLFKGNPNEVKGKILKNISINDKIIQNAYAFTLGVDI